MEYENEENYQNEITITIKDMQVEYNEFKVERNTIIGEFIKIYIKDKGLPKCTKGQLSFKGKKLDESKTFDYYDIKQDDVLYFIEKIRGC